MNYENWMKEWLTTCVKPMVKPRTYEHYVLIARLRIIPRLGGSELTELTATELQKFAAELTETYSVNTVAGIVGVLKSSLGRAYEMGLIERDCSRCIKYPKSRGKEITCYSLAEQKQIEEYVISSGKPKLFGVVLSLYTGLRIGELLALEWSDVDLTKRTISVTKSCRDDWGGGCKKDIGTPKTETSRRIIPLPMQLTTYLRELKKQSLSRYVISGNNGGNVSVRSYQRTFTRIQEKLGFAPRGFHTLRHTFATRALECGMDVKSLSKVLGHKAPTVTLGRYAHSFEEHRSAMMNKLGKLLTTDNK